METRVHATTLTANGSVRKNVLRSVACIMTIPQRSQLVGAERAMMRNTRPRNQASRNDLTEIIHPRRAVLPAALPMPQIMLVKQKRREMVLSVIFGYANKAAAAVLTRAAYDNSTPVCSCHCTNVDLQLTQ